VSVFLIVVEKVKRVSKAEWLQTALKLLEAEGVEAIRVERLARELGISKSGFYWHFKDRDELREQMVEYWAHEFTEVVTANPLMREGAPRIRLEQTMLMILDHDLTRYEVPMRAWAEADPGIARRVHQVYRQRLDFLREIFRDLGFEGDELEMRARLFTCYHTWERPMFPKESKKSLRRLIGLRVALLARKE
jgi:AcrR family transcriptional regulator